MKNQMKNHKSDTLIKLTGGKNGRTTKSKRNLG